MLHDQLLSLPRSGGTPQWCSNRMGAQPRRHARCDLPFIADQTVMGPWMHTLGVAPPD